MPARIASLEQSAFLTEKPPSTIDDARREHRKYFSSKT
jgi:hypothetical protein